MSVTIAIVGRPNVGKSRLFNAIAGKRLAIVHDQPGVTRDPNTVELVEGLVLVDTGGWGLSRIKSIKEASELSEAVEAQALVAIEAAQKILFVIDGRTGVTSLDREIADILRSHKDKVILVVNKVDSRAVELDEGEFVALGFPKWQLVSAEHNIGIEGLKIECLKIAPPPTPIAERAKKERRPSLCIFGRPNVGKSSLTNALLKKNTVIVSPVSGTTRDPVMIDLDYAGKKGDIYHFKLIDTAGLRHKTKVDTSVEYFSQLRSREALEKADIAVLVIDALDGVTTQDKKLAGDIMSSGKPLVVAVNKWDLAAERFESEGIEGFESLKQFEEECKKNLEEHLFFTEGTPFIFISAKLGNGLEAVLKAAQKVEAQQDVKLPTPELNRVVADLLYHRQPRNATGKFFKIYYVTQTGNRPYRLKVFCNVADGIDDSFNRYMAKGFAKHFDLGGCPFFFQFVPKPVRARTSKPIRTLKLRQKLRLSKKQKRRS